MICGVTYDEIRESLGEEIADAVQLLTHDSAEDYHDYVRRIKESGNRLAIEVKEADLTMNMDLSRIPNPTDVDKKRLEKKYKPAIEILKG